ncbi:MAG: hypothetical protein LUB61_01645 [Eggerthellaceae bacterium]|nr:hypothetical protein [Eggerthellaceae bacterium]
MANNQAALQGLRNFEYMQEGMRKDAVRSTVAAAAGIAASIFLMPLIYYVAYPFITQCPESSLGELFPFVTFEQVCLAVASVVFFIRSWVIYSSPLEHRSLPKFLKASWIILEFAEGAFIEAICIYTAIRDLTSVTADNIGEIAICILFAVAYGYVMYLFFSKTYRLSDIKLFAAFSVMSMLVLPVFAAASVLAFFFAAILLLGFSLPFVLIGGKSMK